MVEEIPAITDEMKYKQKKKSQAIQIIFLILLLFAIGSLVSATITIYKYKEMLQNPMGYNMNRFGLEYCSCQNTNKEYVQINAVGNNRNEPINISDYIHCGSVLDNFNDFNNLNLTPIKE